MSERFDFREDVLGRLRTELAFANVLSVNGVPVLLLQAAELASRWCGTDVPYESVTIWPVLSEPDTYLVTFRNPVTGEVDNLPAPLSLASRFHFENYQRWLEDAQSAQMAAVEKRFWKMNRGWWRW